jgi:hypothetical protein
MKRTNYLRELLEMIALYIKLIVQKQKQCSVVLFDEWCGNEMGDFRVQITLAPEPYLLRIKVFDATHLISTFIVNHKVVAHTKRGNVFHVNCQNIVDQKEKKISITFSEVSIEITNPWQFNLQKSSLLFNGPTGDEIRITTDEPIDISTPYLVPACFIFEDGTKKEIEAYAMRNKDTIIIPWREHLTKKNFTLNICNTPVGICRS